MMPQHHYAGESTGVGVPAVQQEVDTTLYNPYALRDETVVETVLRSLDVCLIHLVPQRGRIVRDLASLENLFEFAYSSISPEAAGCLRKWLTQTFPSSAAQFEGSIASMLLTRLSLYFWSVSYPTPGLRDCHRAVELALPVLKAIPRLSFAGESPIEVDDEDDLGFFVKKKKSQRDKKKTKRGSRSAVVDVKPFDNLDVDVPQSVEEAQILAQDLLQDQKCILEHYLDVLRLPEYSELFRKAYIPPAEITPDVSVDDVDHEGDVSVAMSAQDEGDVPAAYPMVQPLKAALYFDSADGFGEWRILISTRADRNLREAKRKDPNLFRIIVKKIKELSNGHFSDDNQKRLTGSDNDIPIYEAKMTRDTRLVYQVDCVKEFESDVEWQVLRVFGIYTHAQLERRFWEAVGAQLAGKGKEYRKRCNFRTPPHHPRDHVFAPASFPAQAEAALPPPSLEIPNLRNEDREELHSLLVLEKFVTFSQALLNSILADQDVAHVFQMTPQEQEIVKHSGSCYVLGRSGTGKTTTMLFKMLGIERTWDSMREEFQDLPRPRQIFVTQSRILAEKVQEYYAKLIESHAAAQRSVEESLKLAEAKAVADDQGLVDRDEEQYWRGDLPKRYRGLKDEHFPLFLTFDHLCRLLEAEFESSKVEGSLTDLVEVDGAVADNLSNDYMLQHRASFVSYGTFLQHYWPHFPQNLTKNLDPSLVFAEFMGVIKGSEQALQSPERHLDREAYLQLSHRSQGTFANQRETIHALFEAYLKQKKIRRDYDAADRTHAVLKALGEFGVPGSKVDFIYIDEAQDNLLIDALVPRSICRNPDGLFWAGDTAQTISAGSSFRFNDLKAFLYRVEQANVTSVPQSPPKSFQLTVNYRSHGGIVSCAQSVVRLITKFWPHAIDILGEERGVIDGIKPVFFRGWDQDTVRYEQFLFGASGSQIEFGAQQCILVRDDAARNRLRKQVGDIGLIMTLYESKGLEFNDVLLYNFFEDSTVDLSQWRVLLNMLPDSKHLKCPRFDETRHSGVCRELKFLYVAITRARKNLWIADCSDKGEPMRAVWVSKNQIQICTPGDDVPQLAMSSTVEEWAKTARTLFDNRRYMQAMHCYERAAMSREKDVAHAYYLREQARSIPASRANTAPRASAFMTAANAFINSAKASRTALESRAYYRIAAECFAEAGNDRQAAEAYLSAQEYTRSAQFYRKADLFDDAVQVVETHRSDIAPADADAILEIAKLYYFKENQLSNATRLFTSFDDALEFMEDFGFDVARADLLEQTGRRLDAAELRREEGQIIRAINLLLEERDDPVARGKALQWLLDGLWQRMSVGQVPPLDESGKPEETMLVDLLSIGNDLLNDATVPDPERAQIRMFQALASRSFGSLQGLGKQLYREYGDVASALLCLDNIFQRPFTIRNASMSEICDMLEAFSIYARELQRIAMHFDPCHSTTTQRLFGFRMSSEDVVTIPEGTFMHDQASQARSFTVADESGISMRVWEFTNLFQRVLQYRLKFCVQKENIACCSAMAFTPCVAYAVYGDCTAAGCSYYHVPRTALDTEWYNMRARIHLQQVMIYQTIRSIEEIHQQRQQCRFWLTALHQALFPPHNMFGSIINLDTSRIPEYQKAVQIVKDWIKDILFNLRPNHERFLTALIEAATLAYAFDRAAAPEYISRVPCVGDVSKRPAELLRVDGRYVVHDLLDALDGTTISSISAGFLALRHICEHQCFFDLSLFCHMVEYLCCAAVVSYRTRRYQLHNTALPRNWLLSVPHSDKLAEKNVAFGLISSFLRMMSSLLEAVYSMHDTADFVLFDDRSFYRFNRVRNVMIIRLQRAICFFIVGYNIPNEKLRWDIMQTLTALQRPGRNLPNLLSGYVLIKHWDDAKNALRKLESRQNSPLDEIIDLRNDFEDKAVYKGWRSARLVYFKPSVGAITQLHREQQPGYSLRADASPFVPRPLATAAADVVVTPSSEEISEDTPGVMEDEVLDTEIDVSAEAGHIEETFQSLAPPTEAEIEAARFIQARYKQKKEWQRLSRNDLADARNRWFKGCLLLASKLRRPYRLLYLGPLPHLLVCLEKANTLAHVIKTKAKRRLNEKQNNVLEDVHAQITKATAFFKAVLRLQKLLAPASELHNAQDVQRLKELVNEANQVLLNLPVGSTHGKEWYWDLKTSVKGIVQERPIPPFRQPKPVLVVEDELLYY
ncbi:hypothetical protein K474DRAFT_723989 [Panus rudis PR-1116 ss-1]|nr:hypothetical protein K474DRAFT_723989 [Panus rudis PR-1116 ss-1]